MRSYEFWRDLSDGVWAIELHDGIVHGCCGPLGADEIDPAFLAGYDYSGERAQWLEGHRDRFTIYEPALPYGPPDAVE